MTKWFRQVLVFTALSLAGCQQYDTPVMARMSGRELDSFRAITHYYSCMAPLIKIAKAGPKLADDQVNNLGYKCRPELEEAARKRELYFAAKPLIDGTPNELYAPTQTERVKLHEKDLAGAFWCDFRTCYVM